MIDDNKVAVLLEEMKELTAMLEKFWEVVQAAQLCRDTNYVDEANNANLETALDALGED